jgi:hypothetical protein
MDWVRMLALALALVLLVLQSRWNWLLPYDWRRRPLSRRMDAEGLGVSVVDDWVCLLLLGEHAYNSYLR